MANLWDILTHIQSLAGPLISLIYPLYASIKTIENPSKLENEQWLAYWIQYSFITLLEMIAEPILYWIPIWKMVKLVVVGWLVLPQFRGATIVYETYVRQQLKKNGYLNFSTNSSSPYDKDKTRRRRRMTKD